MKKIVTIIGARPQIIKSSAISRAISSKYKNELTEIIVHTGQHYDENMSQVFFDEMKIPKPNYNLNVGSGSHGKQTAKMLEGLEAIFLNEKPEAVVVYGDTNSTVAGALAAAKIHIPIVHIEAGLRSFNKSMPEEVNRIACDHMSTLLFSPTVSGVDNLKKEGFSDLNQGKASADNPFVFKCGDIMYDNSMYFSSVKTNKESILDTLNIEADKYVLCTVHRDSNTDVKQNMESIFSGLQTITELEDLTVVLPLHPRTKGKMEEQLSKNLYQKIVQNEKIKIVPPAGFLDIIELEKNARLIVTDSGGLQKESFFFNKPCVILRPQTEWVEIVNNGNAVLADADYDRIISGFKKLMEKSDYTYPSFYGDGKAAEFICSKIIDLL